MLTLAMIARARARVFTIPLTAALPQGQVVPMQEDLQADFHFFSETWTVTYPTRQNVGSPPVLTDDGVTRLSARFKDKSHAINLTTENFLDLATLGAPGRQRSAGLTGDPSQQLHISGIDWPYLYAAKGGIVVETSNNSNVDFAAGDVNYTFKGYLIPTAVFATADSFWDMVLSTMPTLKAGLAMPGPGM